MYKVVGIQTRRIYAAAKTLGGAQKLRVLVAEEEYVNPVHFEVVGPTCQYCGRTCPCGKAKVKSQEGKAAQ